MLAARMTLPHFLVSSEMSFAKSPGRACEHCAPWIGEPRVECGICNAGEMAFPFERRAAGPADAVVPGKPTEPHSIRYLICISHQPLRIRWRVAICRVL
jgi:hypothetical protein